MKLGRITILAASMAAAGFAQAAGVGVRAGTTGIGGDFGWDVAPTLGGRVGYSALSYKTNVDSSDVKYNAKLNLSNLSGLLDWRFAGLFRLSGGLVLNDNRYNLTSEPSSGGIYTISGRTYSASGASISGTVKPGRQAAPYIGFGYGNVAGAGVNFYFDLGIIFQGSPKASLTASCSPSMSGATCSQFQSDTAEEGRKLQDSLSRFKYYPVANVGISIGF
jgi:hypothetical protein